MRFILLRRASEVPVIGAFACVFVVHSENSH